MLCLFQAQVFQNSSFNGLNHVLLKAETRIHGPLFCNLWKMATSKSQSLLHASTEDLVIEVSTRRTSE